MTSIRTLLDHFGFSIRDLAEVLSISHVFLLKVDKGQRRSPTHLTKTLAHPLFAEIDEGYTLEQEKDTTETEWIKAQLAVAQAKLLAEQTKWAALQKKQDSMRKIIHHTRLLNPDAETGKDLTADWWRLQRSKALLWLQLRKPAAEWEQERKLNLLEQDLVWLRKKI